jgi:DNA invertase Pin-like site-specific DNA recombinase
MAKNSRSVQASDPLKFRAAEYVRMSTEHQQYSTQNQAAAIATYAEQQGLTVVRTYTDAGRSGLRIHGRSGLQQLIKDVQSGTADFKTILVYDISRWGRFQDADESAYYEYLCRKAGIQVTYCAEQFENDGSIASTIVKSVKRAMAGEYSRELSTKVFIGQCRLIETGFRQGGHAGFGLRRMLVGTDGTVKAVLASGEEKSIQTDRVILVAGPEEEVRLVHSIYHWFVDDALNETQIAMRLNMQGIKSNLGRTWTAEAVKNVLTNEKYIGNNIYNRRSKKLSARQGMNAPDMWIRKDSAFEAIVPVELFNAARNVFAERRPRYENGELLDHMLAVYKKYGRISQKLIAKIGQAQGKASPTTYQNHFNGMLSAYRQIGYSGGSRAKAEVTRLHSLAIRQKVAAEVEQLLVNSGATVTRDPQDLILKINGEFSIGIRVFRYVIRLGRRPFWHLQARLERDGDLTLLARLDKSNQAPMDYYLLPRGDAPSNIAVYENRDHPLDRFRRPNLDYLVQLAGRTSIRSTA